MVLVSRFILWLVVLVSIANASALNRTIPNWFVLEHRLYESPLVVLDELKNTEITTWTDQQKVQYYDLLANAYVVFSDYESAELALTQGLELKDRAEPYALVNMLTMHAYFKELRGELEAAHSEYQTALRVAEQTGLADATLTALNALISFNSFTIEQYDVALEYVDRASVVAQTVTREFLVADLHNYYGNILNYLDDSTGARFQYQTAEMLYRRLNNNVALSNMLYNRALLLEESGDYISALRSYQAFLYQAEKWGDPSAPFFGYMGKANSYRHLERFDQAYSAILEAQKALPYIIDSVYLFDFWSSVVYIAADVDDFELANKAIAQALMLVNSVDKEQSWTASELLNGKKYVALRQGDYQQAFEYSEELRSLQLNLLEAEKEAALNQLRVDSENAMYQIQTDRLALENRKQQEIISAKNQLQQILLVLLIMLAVSIVILAVTLHRKVRQTRILQQYSAISESVKTSGQRVMDNVAGLLFEQSERGKSPLSVVLFDFSSMKAVREQYGQTAADDAHAWIIETLESELREEDKFGQVSFGRYMLLLPGAEAKVARKQADRLIGYFKEQSIPKWPAAKLALSIGISERTRYDRTPNVLTHRAYTAVDMALNSGVFNVKVLAV